MKSLSRILILLLLTPVPVWAAAWTQKEGGQFLALNGIYYHTSRAFDDNGDRQPTDPFTKREINPYYEYGYSDRLTLGASPFLQSISQEPRAGGKTEQNYGLAETELFARWKLWEGDGFVTSVQPLLKLPSFYAEDNDLKAGRSQMDFELSWMNGYGFNLFGQHHFLMLDTGYRRRLGVLEDQLRVHAGAGIALSERWMVLPQFYYTRPVGTGASSLISVSGQTDYDLSKMQLSAVYKLDDAYSIEFGGFRHVAARSTGDGGGLLVSLWKRW